MITDHPTSTRQSSRRNFLKRGGALAAVSALGFPAVLRSQGSPNSKLQVAFIGVGGMGLATMKGVITHPKVAVTGLCDVSATTLAKASVSYPDAASHADWRELLSDSVEKFDAVTVGIPDHMHAAPAVTALRAKRHLYLQKPMASTIHECRIITEESQKANVVTQLGNQGRSSIESRMAVELIKTGAIGKIKEVLIWENKPLSWWPKNTTLTEKGDPPPRGLDWDKWVGVREPRPYLDNAYHPKGWRAFFDFGVGEMGDMGCHHLDPTFDALQLTAPLRVKQTTPVPGSSDHMWGKQRQVELIFPGTEMTAGDEVKLTWHDGAQRPDESRIPRPEKWKKLPLQGTCWIGESGAIFKEYRSAPMVMPANGSEFPKGSYPSNLEPQSHYHDWVDAILKGGDARSAADFTHGGPLTETVLVGAMADRFAGEWLQWNQKKLEYTGHEGATGLVKREYRDGWKVKGLG